MKKKKKIYISLPISGLDLEAVKQRAEEVKKRISNEHIEAITPFDVCDEKDKPYSYYMGRDIEALIECDGVYVCDGWHSSKGCQAEVHVAVVYDKKIVYERKSRYFEG